MVSSQEMGVGDLTREQYKIIRSFLENSCGILLGEEKEYLIKNRLFSVLEKLQISSFSVLVSILQTEDVAARRVKALVVDAMTTNETYWFRDDAQFDELSERIFPEFFRAQLGGYRIWSAACSSGQEPYSISMCLEDLKNKGLSKDVRILGTDISETVLAEAQSAIYSDLVLSRGLDNYSKAQYFNVVKPGMNALKPEIKARVKFQQFNLLNSFTPLGKFDLIFCRNVLIYFSEAVKRDILLRMASSLNVGGYLFLSSTESMPADITQYESIRGAKLRYFKRLP